MIIFNLYSILVVAVIVGLSHLIGSYNTNFNKLFSPEFLFLSFLISSIFESLSIKSRLYFFPLWLISAFFFIWKSYVVYNLTGILISLLVFIIIILIASYIRYYFENRKWEKSKEQLKYFLEDEDMINVDSLIFYPNYIYTENPFYEKYLDFIFVKLQNVWFNRKDVKNHYLKIINLIVQRSSDDAQKVGYLKSLIESNVEKGIDEYLFENLKKRI